MTLISIITRIMIIKLKDVGALLNESKRLLSLFWDDFLLGLEVLSVCVTKMTQNGLKWIWNTSLKSVKKNLRMIFLVVYFSLSLSQD